MKNYVILFILTNFIFFTISSQLATKKYENYSLIRGIPVTEKHLDFFKNLSYIYDINYWRSPGQLYRPVEFLLSPNNRHDFIRRAKIEGVYFATLMDDVQRALDSQIVKPYIRRNMESFDWTSFYLLNDIYDWMKDLETQYPKIMKVYNIGKTVENRGILAARIAHPSSKGKNRRKVMVEGGIHAREWVAPAFVTYFLHQILTAPKQRNSTLRDIAIAYEWLFVPVMNPDGYEFTHSTDRMYRKNMNSVDLNRNFGIAFGTVGVSQLKTSETYCGPAAFSEPETQAMASFVHAHRKNLMFYLAFHAYGQYMIIPYTHVKTHVDNFDTVSRMGLKAAAKIQAKYGTQYTVGTAYDTVGYMTSGVSGCWVKKTYGVPYVLTFELRDEGQHGFALPPQQILPTCQETMEGIMSLLSTKPEQTEKLKKEFKGSQVRESVDVIAFWFCFLFNIVFK